MRPSMATAAGSYGTYGAGYEAQHQMSPAGERKAVMKTVDDLNPELRALVQTMQQFGLCTSWSELDNVLRAMDDDVVYDTPVFWIPGKSRMRSMCTVFGFFGKCHKTPKVVKIQMLDEKRAELDVESDAKFHINRHWFLPLTYLIPDIPVKTTSSISVKGWNDKIGSLKVRYNNLPALPWIFRAAMGWGAGTITSMLEPAAFKLHDWWVSGVNTASSMTEPIIQSPMVQNVTQTVSDTVKPVTQTVAGTLESITGTKQD